MGVGPGASQPARTGCAQKESPEENLCLEGYAWRESRLGSQGLALGAWSWDWGLAGEVFTSFCMFFNVAK